MTIARVSLWGRTIGAVALDAGQRIAAFEYDRAFRQSGIEVAPLIMPLSDRVYRFPTLPFDTFRGLPGLLADSLPDRFGNALIDQWLAASGCDAASFNAVERLCYTGKRGMGALEFAPVQGPRETKAAVIDVARLVALAASVLAQREGVHGHMDEAADEGANARNALKEILAVGTSAGGARAKAVIAINPRTLDIRSGQIDAGAGFEQWLIKFDGVANNKDKELADPVGYGAIEYAYHLMVCAAGITMSDCHLLEENQRRHFITRRFDRAVDGEKLHMQSLGGLAHFDFNAAGAYSYEQALQVMRTLGLPMATIEEQFRRMAFNIVARNQDDHVKNIAFLMNKQGVWSLAPAFDVTYAFNPVGGWTSQHQMTMNGRRDAFTRSDFRACAKSASMKRGRAEAIIENVTEAVKRWSEFATEAKIPSATVNAIARSHRLNILDTPSK